MVFLCKILERALIWNGVKFTEHSTIRSLLTISHIVKFQNSKYIFTSKENEYVWCYKPICIKDDSSFHFAF